VVVLFFFQKKNQKTLALRGNSFRKAKKNLLGDCIVLFPEKEPKSVSSARQLIPQSEEESSGWLYCSFSKKALALGGSLFREADKRFCFFSGKEDIVWMSVLKGYLCETTCSAKRTNAFGSFLEKKSLGVCMKEPKIWLCNATRSKKRTNGFAKKKLNWPFVL
jgi:hypothetical protein